MFDLLIVALFASFLFLAFGVLAWLADRPPREDYPDHWTG